MSKNLMWLGLFGEPKGEKILVNLDSLTYLRPSTDHFDGHDREEYEGTLYVAFGNNLAFRVILEDSARLMNAISERIA